MLFNSKIYSHDSVAAHTVTVTGRQRQEPKDWHGAACLFSASQVCMDLACTGTVTEWIQQHLCKSCEALINHQQTSSILHHPLSHLEEREREGFCYGTLFTS